MATIDEILKIIDDLAPFAGAFDRDPVGLQVGSRKTQVQRVVVSLDRSPEAIQFAIDTQAQLLLCHHPLIFSPLSQVTDQTSEGLAVIELIRSGIAFIAAHTNWDVALGGINDSLADCLGLVNVNAFGDSKETRKLKIVVFCPHDATQQVIDALTEAGAGQIGNYSRCAFVGSGTGTFVPGEGSHPTIGTLGDTEEVAEDRIEMVLPYSAREVVISALRRVHPYEEPAYDLYELIPEKPYPISRIGELSQSLPLASFVEWVDQQLDTRCLAWGDGQKTIQKVAVVGGSGDDLWRSALHLGADVLVTGEVKQHQALEAQAYGIAMISAGHYATENPGMASMTELLRQRLPEVEWTHFSPEKGTGGRPL